MRGPLTLTLWYLFYIVGANESPPIIGRDSSDSAVDSSLTKFSFLPPPSIIQDEIPPHIISRSIQGHSFVNSNWKTQPTRPEIASPDHAVRRGPPYDYTGSPPRGDHVVAEPDYDYEEFYSDSGPRNQQEYDYHQSGQRSENEPIRSTVDHSHEPNSRKSGNLAALLAGAGSIAQNPSINQSEKGVEPEYYDALYEEFMDMYYDPEAKTVEEGPRTPSPTRHLPPPIFTRRSSTTTTSKQPLSTTTQTSTTTKRTTTTTKPTTTTTTSQQYTTTSSSPTTKALITTTKTTTTRRNPTTTKAPTTIRVSSTTKSKTISSPSAPIASIQPISLSEVLQELNMNLPQFLGSLASHGTSLKEFTAKLQTKKLSKMQLRRAKGNFEFLFKMLDEGSEKTLSHSSSTTSAKPTKTSTTTTLKSEKPSSLTFGEKPGGILLTKTKSNADEVIITKPPIAIKLDIITMMKNEGVSKADVLGQFNSMFDVSEGSHEVTSTTTAKPRLTTISLKTYRPEPDRSRPYRPRHDQGWWDSRRGLINRRMSSTQRPTIRPPYVPRANSPISSGEASSSPVFGGTGEASSSPVFGETIIVDKVNNRKKRPEETVERRRPFQNIRKENKSKKISAEDIDVATRSAIMAAGILGGVALTVFIAIFVVVKYRSHLHKHRRRTPLTLPSDSSSSNSSPSLPPIYSTRSCVSRDSYGTSGFWNTLKKRFDPYAIHQPPPSIRDPYFYEDR